MNVHISSGAYKNYVHNYTCMYVHMCTYIHVHKHYSQTQHYNYIQTNIIYSTYIN